VYDLFRPCIRIVKEYVALFLFFIRAVIRDKLFLVSQYNTLMVYVDYVFTICTKPTLTDMIFFKYSTTFHAFFLLIVIIQLMYWKTKSVLAINFTPIAFNYSAFLTIEIFTYLTYFIARIFVKIIFVFVLYNNFEL
jgi:hypothetical protein